MSLHIGAKKGDIAETILIPGDPLRAKFVADNLMEKSQCFNEVRNALGFTGMYKGKKVSVMGTGMGIPSTSIYVNELISEFAVKNIMRVGTCGAIRADLKLGEVILAMSASTDSSVNRIQFGGLDYAATADFDLLHHAWMASKDLGVNVTVGGVFSTDTFYSDVPDRWRTWAEHGILGAEMESAVLYTLAAKHKVRALSILTVSDNIITHEYTTAKEREQSFTGMMKIALEAALKI